MDIDQTKLPIPNHTWNPEMSVENHILHDQVPLNPIWPSYPLQTIPSSATSGQMPSATTVYPTHERIGNFVEEEEEPEEELSAMKEMLYKVAAMQPVDIDPATIPKPKRRNVRISDDPQSVAARHRRERISEKIRILQRLVPGGTKMDTASMLDEAIRYVKFLKRQIRVLQQQSNNQQPPCHVDWRVAPHKTLVPTPSTSLEAQPRPGFTFSAKEGHPFFFNHEGCTQCLGNPYFCKRLKLDLRPSVL